MPGTWNVDDLTEGGLASITEFIGRLDDVEDDVEGKFGDQKELHFSDVEIIEAADDVTLDEGRYTTWVKQSNKKNSTDGKMVADWAAFAQANDLGELPGCFFGVLMRWKKVTYEFGDDMSPGRALVPTEIIETGGKKAKTKTKTKTKSTEPAAAAPPSNEDEDDGEDEGSSVPEALVEVIHATIGEDGATREMIRRALSKKQALRTALTEAGGLDAVLDALQSIEVDDGTYTLVEEDEEEDPV